MSGGGGMCIETFDTMTDCKGDGELCTDKPGLALGGGAVTYKVDWMFCAGSIGALEFVTRTMCEAWLEMGKPSVLCTAVRL